MKKSFINVDASTRETPSFPVRLFNCKFELSIPLDIRIWNDEEKRTNKQINNNHHEGKVVAVLMIIDLIILSRLTVIIVVNHGN